MSDEAKQQLTCSDYLDFMPSDARHNAELVLVAVADPQKESAAVDAAEYLMVDERIKAEEMATGESNGTVGNLRVLRALRDAIARRWNESPGWGAKERTAFELTRARCLQVKDLCSGGRQEVQAPGKGMATDFFQAIVNEAGRQI